MRLIAAFLAVPLMAATAVAEDPKTVAVAGDYVEFRTADVFTGPCFANAEVGLTGSEAIMAWHVRQGTWNGVDIDGLSVIAVVRAHATLGDYYADLGHVRSVIVVDSRATPEQRDALVDMARRQSPDLLTDVVAVEALPILFEQGDHGSVSVAAGDVVSITTRSFHEGDHICRNESVFYEPLASNLTHAMPVMTVQGSYQAGHLGKTWREMQRRGSFVGSFAIPAIAN